MTINITTSNQDLEPLVIEVVSTIVVEPSDMQAVESQIDLYEAIDAGAKVLTGSIMEAAGRTGASARVGHKVSTIVASSWDVVKTDDPEA